MGHGGHHRILSRRLIEVSQILQRQQEPCTGCDPLEAKVRGLWHGGGGHAWVADCGTEGRIRHGLAPAASGFGSEP